MYTVTLFKNNSGKIGLRHPSGQISYRTWRSWSDAIQFCKTESLAFEVTTKVNPKSK